MIAKREMRAGAHARATVFLGSKKHILDINWPPPPAPPIEESCVDLVLVSIEWLKYI